MVTLVSFSDTQFLRTPLHWAAYSGRADVVDYLLNHIITSVGINTVDKVGAGLYVTFLK